MGCEVSHEHELQSHWAAKNAPPLREAGCGLRLAGPTRLAEARFDVLKVAVDIVVLIIALCDRHCSRTPLRDRPVAGHKPAQYALAT